MRFREINIHVREAKIDDREKILEFRKLYPFNHFDDYFPNLKSKITNVLFGRYYKLFLSEIKREVVGCSGVVRHSLYRNIFYSDDLFIMPQFRGLGIGKKLVSRRDELLSGGKKIRVLSRIASENIAPMRISMGLGTKPFQFIIFYMKYYKPLGKMKSNYKIESLTLKAFNSRVRNRLYEVFFGIVGKEYFYFFNKTNKLNFLFPNQNYREIITLLIKMILKVNKYRILFIKGRNGIIGYALNIGNQNQIYLAPSVIDNQSIANCNQALYDYLKPSDCIENYYHLRREAISELTYSGGNSRKIEVLYKSYQSIE